MRALRRPGFTLVEVLVALVLTSLAVVLAHGVFAAVSDVSGRVQESRRRLDRAANADRLLGAAFLSLDVGFGQAAGFDGRPDQVAFSSWLLVADGWHERRRVVLKREGAQWVAQWGPDLRVVLADNVEAVHLEYLLDPGARTRWVREWVSDVSAPLAIRIRLMRRGGSGDTALYLIKARG